MITEIPKIVPCCTDYLNTSFSPFLVVNACLHVNTMSTYYTIFGNETVTQHTLLFTSFSFFIVFVLQQGVVTKYANKEACREVSLAVYCIGSHVKQQQLH